MNQPLAGGRNVLPGELLRTTTVPRFSKPVRNPGWLLPYVACVMVGAGLIWQFVSHIARARRKNDSKAVSAEPRRRLRALPS